MHAMQLERSLLHYSVQENNVRCELFGWFFGADKSREQSKDFAFAFFQKLVNCILSLIAAKKTVAPRRNSISSPVPSKIQTLPYSALISMWTECIGDGEPSNHRTLPPSLALEACKLSFSPAMQQHSHFTMFRENLYRQGLGHKTIDLEDFFRGAMTAWQLTFDTQLQEVSKTVESAGVLDIDGFARCLSMNKLDFTTGERYELFDMLTQEDDTSVIPSKTMAHFIMEAKYLRPIPPSTLLNTN
ncbi:hypothetical protein PHYBOEH_003990 [Phytophthora boehmeriae]|uniref:Uncharacterized protein n=1 Tax=Phytophthora boehmeriae TaxID=109152 RepID=A0A8T1WTS7_9STRA|nr:hypothetical protein PHYBOEH_003990 [Phytophthora boehmeriae]